MDYFVHEDNGKSEPRHVGFSFILPLDLKDSTGSKKVPITGFKHRPIGQITSKPVFSSGYFITLPGICSAGFWVYSMYT